MLYRILVCELEYDEGDNKIVCEQTLSYITPDVTALQLHTAFTKFKNTVENNNDKRKEEVNNSRTHHPLDPDINGLG